MVAVSHVEVADDEGELDELGIGEMPLHLLGHVVSRFGGVSRHVLGPEDGCLFPWGQQRRIHVLIRADGGDVLIGDSQHPAESGVVRESVVAPV